MTSGVLLFAFNTSAVDYVKIAKWNAANIKRHLNLPVSIVTDSEIDDAIFDQVIYAENKFSNTRLIKNMEVAIKWRNAGRYAAYELSPYDTTLLLDVDYIVASNQLQVLLDDSRPFICTQQAIDTDSQNVDLNKYSKYKLPMAWATVIKFNKSETANLIFDIMRMVQTNYRHYALLYGFNSSPYRNDFALSIALTMASGHLITNQYAAPFKMFNVNPGNEVTRVGTDEYELKYLKTVNNVQKMFRLAVSNQDIHIMGKDYLEKIVDNTI
jgi:hypothetical protein